MLLQEFCKEIYKHNCLIIVEISSVGRYLRYLFRMLIDLMKENGLTLKKSKGEVISCRDYNRHNANKLVLLGNAPGQAESLLHSLEQTAGGISFHMNTNET